MRTFLFLTLSAYGWSQNMTVPTVGSIYNPASAGIHAMPGLSGAASLSDVLVPSLRAASVSADGDAAIVAKDDGTFLVSGISTGSTHFQLISSALTFRTAWANGSAIVYAEGSWFKVSLGAGAWMLSPLSPGLPDGSVNALDYDAANSRFYVSVDGQGVFSVSVNEGTLTLLAPLASAKYLAHNVNQVFATTDDSIFTVKSGTASLFANLASKVVGIAASTDSKRLYVASANQVTIYSSAGVPGDPLPVQANKLERLNYSSLLLSNESGQPVWILNDSDVPFAFFVPAWKRATVQGARQ